MIVRTSLNIQPKVKRCVFFSSPLEVCYVGLYSASPTIPTNSDNSWLRNFSLQVFEASLISDRSVNCT
jgi:hypothetical protein